MAVRILGIDCATVLDEDRPGPREPGPTSVVLSEVRLCTAEQKAADLVVRWLCATPARRSLLAIDAPLGWPKDLSSVLVDHRAGAPLSVEPNLMFRRATDRFVYEVLRKTPLDIGADRIARTAHSALGLLADIGDRRGPGTHLAWDPSWSGIAAIEVYPAATLLARRMKSSGYKKPGDVAERAKLVQDLRSHLTMPESYKAMIESADALDAAVCVLAGADFIQGHAYPPNDRGLAEREGWIWFRAAGSAG